MTTWNTSKLTLPKEPGKYIFCDIEGERYEAYVYSNSKNSITINKVQRHLTYSQNYIALNYPKWRKASDKELITDYVAKVADDFHWVKYPATKPKTSALLLVKLKNGHYVATDNVDKQTMYVVGNAVKLFKTDEISEWRYI